MYKNRHKKKKKNNFYNIYGWSFILIALVLIGLFNVYPVINSLILSTMSGKGVVYSFNGLGNIKRLFSDTVFFQTALKNTFIFFIFQVPIMLSLALLIASLLNDKKLKFKGFFSNSHISTLCNIISCLLHFI